MIGKRQLALVEAARDHFQEKWGLGWYADLLEEEGGVTEAAKLTTAGFNGVMDRCTVLGFRDRRRPVLSAETREGIERLLAAHYPLEMERDVVLGRVGQVRDLRDLDGNGLLALLIHLQKEGAPVEAFIERRMGVSRKQLALLHVARSKVGLPEDTMTWALHHLCGVTSAAVLDARGFDLVMALMREKGFEWRQNIDRAGLPIGHRPGFASAEQLALIQALWLEWHGTADDTALGAWLERFFQVSALRFLKSATASKAITALKAMKRRQAAPSKVTA